MKLVGGKGGPLTPLPATGYSCIKGLKRDKKGERERGGGERERERERKRKRE